MIGIIGAMDVEVDGIKSEMTSKETKTIAGIDFVSGLLYGKQCVVARCSPGKVNAAACAQIMALEFHPRMIINPGVAGGIGEGIKIGDVVIGTSCVQHDCDSQALGDPAGMVSGINLVNIPCDEELSQKIFDHAKKIYDGQILRGVIVTGDQFISDSKKGKELNETFGGLACEMEGGAIAHVCYINKIPFGVIRTISDNGNDDAHMDFPTFVALAAAKEIELINSLIADL